jgi:hypothetical protein
MARGGVEQRPCLAILFMFPKDLGNYPGLEGMYLQPQVIMRQGLINVSEGFWKLPRAGGHVPAAPGNYETRFINASRGFLEITPGCRACLQPQVIMRQGLINVSGGFWKLARAVGHVPAARGNYETRVPLALPGCPWPPKKKNWIYFQGNEGKVVLVVLKRLDHLKGSLRPAHSSFYLVVFALGARDNTQCLVVTVAPP